jgi:hypothetical protein
MAEEYKGTDLTTVYDDDFTKRPFDLEISGEQSPKYMTGAEFSKLATINQKWKDPQFTIPSATNRIMGRDMTKAEEFGESFTTSAVDTIANFPDRVMNTVGQIVLEAQDDKNKLTQRLVKFFSGIMPQLPFVDKQPVDLANAVIESSNLFRKPYDDDVVDALDGREYPVRKWAQNVIANTTKAIKTREELRALNAQQRGVDQGAFTNKFASIAGAMAPVIAAGYGTGAITGALGAAPATASAVATGTMEVATGLDMAGQYAYDTARDYLDRTGDSDFSEFSPKDAKGLSALGYGAIGSMIEFGFGGVEPLFAQAFTKTGIENGIMKAVGKVTVGEAWEEFLQDWEEFLFRKADGTNTRTWGEVLKDSVKAALWGALLGGVTGGVVYRTQRRNIANVLTKTGLDFKDALKVADQVLDDTQKEIQAGFDSVVNISGEEVPQTVRSKIRQQVAATYEDIDLPEAEKEDAIDAITNLEVGFIMTDSAEKGIAPEENPILQGEVNQIGWFREGIPEQVADQVRALNDEIAGLRQQLREENTKETKDFNKIDDLEAKIEQFYAKLPKEVSDIVETDRAKVRQMLDEQMARARDLQDRRKVVRQVQQRALKALQSEQESDVQKSLRRLQEQTRTEEQKARAEERKQWQEQRKLRRAIEKLRQDMARRKSKLPVSQELFADADLVYQALRDSGFTDSQISTMAETDIINAVMPYGISPQILKQSDLAAENARLDDIYPAYDGETIEIFDYDTISVSDWASKNIEKQDSFETDEGIFTNYKLVSDNRNMPTFTVFESKDGWIVRNAYIPESEQGKGVGTNFYKYMNLKSIEATGKPLRSTQPRTLNNGTEVFELSDLGHKLWDSLVRNNLAVKKENGTYVFNAPKERTVYNSNGDRIAKSKEALTNFWRWFGDSKVVDEQGRPLVVYHGSETANITEFKGKNFFFSQFSDIAGSYGTSYDAEKGEGIDPNIYSVYLKIENPLDIRDLRTFKSVLDNINAEHTEAYKNLEKLVSNQFDWNDLSYDLQSYYGSRESFENIMWTRLYLDNQQGIINYAKSNGFDGIMDLEQSNLGGWSYNGFIAFNPTQIKSVDNRGTYSADTPNIYYQAAYAGSAVDYDRPSLEAIGSGEGAAAHGWGLYYALDKKIAERYRYAFTQSESNKYYEDKLNDLYTSLIDKNEYSKATIIESLLIRHTDEDIDDMLAEGTITQKDVDWFRSIEDKYLDKTKKEGQVHEVDIPEMNFLLDEQKGFSEQPEFVQEKIQETLNDVGIKYIKDINLESKTDFISNIKKELGQEAADIMSDIYDLEIEYKNTKKDNKELDDAWDKWRIFELENDTKGFDPNIVYSFNHITGEEIYDALVEKLGTAKQASQVLEKHGIKGITYEGGMDGRCFVIFNPKDVKVLRKKFDELGNVLFQGKKANGLEPQTRVSGKGKDFRGFYAPELRLISLAQNADPTTLAHELAHDWMQQFFRHYRSGKASESFMKSWGAVEKALGITENDITVPDKASEAFARAYEGWILNNKDWAKNIDIEDKDRDKMIEIFKRYQGYLTDVYEDLNNPYFLETWGETGKLKPELQAWFDKVTNPTDLIDAQVQTGKITPEQAQTKQITRTVNEVVQAVENKFTPEEKEEIAAVERMNDTSRYEVEGGNKNSLQNRLSGLARDIDANNIALKRYDTHRDMLEVAKAADDFVRTRRDEAINIINGIEPEKEGLYASDLYTALERFAVENNDVDLALELTNSKVAQDLAKEWGQRIAGFRNFTGDGDFDVVSQLKSLDNKFKKDYDEKGKQRVNTAADEYVEELNKADDSQDVDAFLDSIKCQ